MQMIRLDWEGYAAGTYARTRWEALRPTGPPPPRATRCRAGRARSTSTS
ncbi:MAG: hypothetical protein IPH09_11085 [bacterium]|nr:hypothetical protein [bacterium]